jgi:Tfp pilus assembly protein PilV
MTEKRHTAMVNSKREAGFTLVEVMIAFVVMMVVSLAMGAVFFYSIQNNVGGSDRALAMGVAQQQLEQLRSVAYTDTTLVAGTTIFPSVSTGGRVFRVVRTIADEKNADNSLKGLKKITITVTPQAAGGNWIRTPIVLVSYRSSLAQGSWAAL